MLNAKGVDFDDDGIEGKLARGGECLHPSGGEFSFLSLVLGLGFWKKPSGTFFWFVQ